MRHISICTHTVKHIQSNAYSQTHTAKHIQTNAYSQTHTVKRIQPNTYSQTHTVKRIQSNAYSQTHTAKHIQSNTYSQTHAISAYFDIFSEWSTLTHIASYFQCAPKNGHLCLFLIWRLMCCENNSNLLESVCTYSI